MKQAIQALISNTFATKRAAAPVSTLRTVSREELRAVAGGSPKGTWLTTTTTTSSPKGTW